MGKDKRVIERGQCTICPCEEFDTEGSIFCEYCGHPPINHVVLDNHEQASKKMKISHEHGAEEEDRCEYNATGQRNDDTTVLQSIEIDPVSTAMPNNGDSEKQDHNEIFEIDEIPSSTPNDGDSEKQDHAEIVELKKSDSTQADLPNPDGLQKLQKLVDEIVKTQLHQNTSVKLSVSRKNDSVFAHCNVCKTEVALRSSISKCPYCVRQHLATQMHKTNVHSRESDVSLELSELHAQIKMKFPNVFILKESSAFCRDCKTDMSLLGRNIMGNLAQHVRSSGHLHNNARKGDARDIASCFVPVAKKSSNLANAKN